MSEITCPCCDAVNYQLTNTFPEQYRKMRCKTCGDERDLTTEESIEHCFSEGEK